MPIERANDLHAFKSFVDEQLSGQTVPTVDEVWARWQYENESDEKRAGYCASSESGSGRHAAPWRHRSSRTRCGGRASS